MRVHARINYVTMEINSQCGEHGTSETARCARAGDKREGRQVGGGGGMIRTRAEREYELIQVSPEK